VRVHDAIELEVHPPGGLPFPEMHVVLTARPQIPPGTRLAVRRDLRVRSQFALKTRNPRRFKRPRKVPAAKKLNA
jgi:hypothetical protein